MIPEIHVNDEPILRATVKDQDNKVVDVSGASSLKIFIESPSGAVNERTAILTTDGSDGKIEYQTTAMELSVEGEWRRQAEVTIGARPYRSNIQVFRVYPNL